MEGGERGWGERVESWRVEREGGVMEGGERGWEGGVMEGGWGE
jgi:hypothetical protein